MHWICYSRSWAIAGKAKSKTFKKISPIWRHINSSTFLENTRRFIFQIKALWIKYRLLGNKDKLIPKKVWIKAWDSRKPLPYLYHRWPKAPAIQAYAHTQIHTNPRNTGRPRRKMMSPLLCRLTMNEIDYILSAVFIYRKFSLLKQSLSFKNTAVHWKHLPCDHLGLSRAGVGGVHVSSLPWNLSIGMEHNRCLSP